MFQKESSENNSNNFYHVFFFNFLTVLKPYSIVFGMVIFPKLWNNELMVSIHKKGNPADCNNYGDISLINKEFKKKKKKKKKKKL